jgi:hypothetical protein
MESMDCANAAPVPGAVASKELRLPRALGVDVLYELMKELSDTELPDPENDTVRSMRYSQPSVLSDLNDLSLAIVALQLVRVDPAKSTRVVVAVCLTHARLLLISKASNAINPNRTRPLPKFRTY